MESTSVVTEVDTELFEVDEIIEDDAELCEVDEVVLDAGLVDENEDTAPWVAVPCNKRSIEPPVLQKVRKDAANPVELGKNTIGMVIEAPAANVEPTAGKLAEVKPFPIIGSVML